MNVLLELQKFTQHPITTQLLLGVLKDYERPFDKISELVHQGYLIQLRRGMYILGDQLNVQRPELSLISNHLYGPSYISLETGMFFWGLIPEKVYVISAMTMKQSKNIETPLGIFNYRHVSKEYYWLGIESQDITSRQTILVGSPEKCICDKIITTSGVMLRSKNQAYQFLVEDMRIDLESISALNLSLIETILPFCSKKGSIEKLIEFIDSL
jgi:hypothetical protein